MKNILKTTTLALVCSMALTGCIKETFPTDSATSGQVSDSPTAVEAIVNAIPVNMTYPYSVYGGTNNYGFDFGYPGMMCATDAATGDVICSSGDEGSGYDWFTYWQSGILIGPTQTVCRFPWKCYYTFIKSSNDVVGLLAGVELSDAQKSYLGFAKAYRAQLYLDLARLYDPLDNKYTDVSGVKGLTVPIVDENTTEDMARNNPRVTREAMFEFILRDLDDAEALLANYTSSSKTNPSLAVVYGIKARAYLWLGGFDSSKYADAATYARKAIDASKCTIMTETEWLNPKTGFNKANNSWMWYLPQSTEGIANLMNFAAWRSSEATWGYGGKYVFEGVTSNFYNEISDTDWRKRAFVGPDAKYADYSDITNLTAAQFANLPAYANLKFHPAEGETATYSVGNVTDIPMMRVEEMYLIEAEATAHADASAGLQLLKTFMAKRDPEFSTSAVSSADVVEEIIWNKRIELWGEGVVFYDFKRLNYSLKTGYVGTNVPSDCRFSTDGRAPWWNFCIPETETQQNTALESQNNPNPVGIIDPWVQ